MVGVRLKLYALIALAFIAGAVGLHMAGIRQGIDKHKQKITDKRLRDVQAAKEVSDDVEALDDSGLSKRAHKWVRNGLKR